MNCDWNLLRWLLNEAKSGGCPVAVRPYGATHSGARSLDIGERDFSEVYQHILCLGNFGFAKVEDLGIMYEGLPSGALIRHLTAEGQNFLNKPQKS